MTSSRRKSGHLHRTVAATRPDIAKVQSTLVWRSDERHSKNKKGA
jgi:hypothetical protein